jgi:Ca2+-transporting ATPase
VWALNAQPERATTVCFMTLALAQVFHLGNARSRHAVLRPARILANRYAIGAVLLAMALQLAALYVPPVAHALKVTPLGWVDWAIVLGLAAIPAVVGQALKAWSGRSTDAPTGGRLVSPLPQIHRARS